jgi:NADH oxidase (H2O2-forming)
MDRTDVLVIGGGPSGMIAAATGKSFYQDKDVLLVRKEEKVLIPCAIPYVFSSLGGTEKNVIPDAMVTDVGVRLKIDEVLSLDRDNKACMTADGTEISFEKLVMATGSNPLIPQGLKGKDLDNVFVISKRKEYLDEMLDKIETLQRVVVVGGGFIGVEVGGEINKMGKNVTIVEITPHILGRAFDKSIVEKAEEILANDGVRTRTGTGVREILGNGRVTGVLLDNGDILEADAVILSMGYRPNTGLAEDSGFRLNRIGFLQVDEYMRTDHPDLFAVGDCAEKKDFLTRKVSGVMLASTACSEARITGYNLFKLNTVKTFNGTIGIWSTVIGDIGFGAAGLTETAAQEEGFDVVAATGKGVDKHPGTLPGTGEQIVKLIAHRESSQIIGGEVMGGCSAGELTNIIGFAIENRMTVNSLLTAQIGSHPLLSASPAAYPLIRAAEMISAEIGVGLYCLDVEGLASAGRSATL